ncbi:hypothetical protein [uncultured Lamprocystis sp.]|jgi:hypothetical protein|uniref:hypothetical protein n=1 Tax=uncultured Lamprocystis sp. TaxID=543132 RepID=UPI0025F14073|nr:hypothetical protein [uncultured Lamprocystis sp.]
MNNVHCMFCGHAIDLGDAYNDYEGPLRCSVCKSLMTVRVEDGHLRSMTDSPQAAAAPKAQRSQSHNT